MPVISIKIVVTFVFAYCWIVRFGLLATTFVFVSTEKQINFTLQLKKSEYFHQKLKTPLGYLGNHKQTLLFSCIAMVVLDVTLLRPL